MLFGKMNCGRCTEKRILKDHEVSKRGKVESRGEDVRMLEMCEEKQRHRRKGVEGEKKRKNEKEKSGQKIADLCRNERK